MNPNPRLQLLHLLPSDSALAQWGHRHRLISADGDAGYALHALLTAAFGPLAPKPFRHFGGTRGLLAYSSADPEALHLAARLAPPDVAKALGLDHFALRPLPDTWPVGHPLAFELRIRPTVRQRNGGEIDAFLHGLSTPAPDLATDPGSLTRRADCYRQWLDKQLAQLGGARLIRAEMTAFCLNRGLRRGQAESTTGKRPVRQPAGPDACFTGQLEITDGPAFGQLLARGLGRHRAFGYGMLLLRPAEPC